MAANTGMLAYGEGQSKACWIFYNRFIYNNLRQRWGCQTLQIFGVQAQLSLLNEPRFQGGSEQVVSGLPLLLQNLFFDLGLLLRKIVLVDGIVLRNAVDGPIGAESERIAHVRVKIAHYKAPRNVDFLVELQALQPVEVPINFLNPRPGTPFAARSLDEPMEGLSFVAMARFALPRALIRFAGGREQTLFTSSPSETFGEVETLDGGRTIARLVGVLGGVIIGIAIAALLLHR